MGTSFQIKVWKALQDIPYGETISYKQLAKWVGNEKSYRAVGNACGYNHCLIIIPCHRVVASDNTLGGFSSGIDNKQRLLNLEKEGDSK